MKVAIIVPFRDNDESNQRTQQLFYFIEYFLTFFSEMSSIQYFIYIIEQSNDNKKFNRGKLLNIGFKIASKTDNYDSYIFHDVDLIPSKSLSVEYSKVPKTNPIHIANVWGRYSANPAYFGGIVAFSKPSFYKINGFPNNYWGWGGEDDALWYRTTVNDFKPIKLRANASNGYAIKDLEDMNLNKKLDYLKKTDAKCMNKYELLKEEKKTWQTNGLNSLEYSENYRGKLNSFALIINVDL